MNRIFSISALILLLGLSVFVGGCAPRGTLKNYEQWMPRTFNPKESTLLIMCVSHTPRMVRKFDELVGKRYPYPYKVIPLGTKVGPGTDYSDTTKYKYMLTSTSEGRRIYDGRSPNGTMSLKRDWRFENLITKRKYEYTNRRKEGKATTLVYVLNTIVKKYGDKKK